MHRPLAITFALCVGALLGGCQPSAPTGASDGGGAQAEVPEAADLVVGTAFTEAELDGRVVATSYAARFGDDCVGRIAESPDRVIEVTDETVLTLDASARGTGFVDLTLVVVGPDGAARCADDADTLDPLLAGPFAPGRYDVYVGVRGQEAPPWVLRVRAGNHTPEPVRLGIAFPPAIESGPAPTPIEGGSGGGLRIEPGTGPGTLEGRAGGTRQAREHGSECVGWVSSAPDHVLELTGAEELTLRVRSNGDTTLVALGPGDVVFCRDDDDGLDPVLRQLMQPGTWEVYVGSWEREETPTYSLTVAR